MTGAEKLKIFATDFADYSDTPDPAAKSVKTLVIRGSILFWNFEAVADAAQRLQIHRMAGIAFNFFAEAANVNVD
jgi:hypothetical protein